MEDDVARRGRKRQIGERTKSGRLKARPAIADKGTAELQRMRKWLAGQGDPALADYPLGILLANNDITEQHHQVACRYAFLHSVVFGRASVAAASFERIAKSWSGDWDDQWLADREAELTRLTERLKGEPARLRMVLDSVVVYERTPRWMRPVRPRISDVREAELFAQALALLAGGAGRAMAA
jgi:hypothetical protein